jgi:hypothetical protein
VRARGTSPARRCRRAAAPPQMVAPSLAIFSNSPKLNTLPHADRSSRRDPTTLLP